jgi:predicted aldo/keto reductase-like oxidoreductase
MSDRREFLKKTIKGGAVAGMASLIPEIGSSGRISTEKGLSYRNLGSTGYKVTEIGFGAMNMRDPELVRAAIDAGINNVDTAHIYMRGINEQVVGEEMKTRRKEVFLTTKILPHNQSIENLTRMIETSLERLQTDHVDLLLIHNLATKEHPLNPDWMKVFAEAKKKGQARFIGVSCHINSEQVIDGALEAGVYDAVLVGYNYFSPPQIAVAIKKAREKGLAVIGMKNILNPLTQPWAPLEDIREKTGSQGMTPQQALIKWVLEDNNVDVTIPGVTNFQQLSDDIAIMNMKLTPDAKRGLAEYTDKFNGIYCHGVAGCTECIDQCPKGMCPADINRCLAYDSGYGDYRLALENYKMLPASSKVEVCNDCDECVVKCAHGLDIAANIARAKKIFG